MMVIVDKFSKAVRIAPGKSTYTAIDWAKLFFADTIKEWGFPQVLISDRDAKFTSEFWTWVFKRAKVKLGITAAYHPSAAGQTERFNTAIETMLRCLLCDSRRKRFGRTCYRMCNDSS